LWTRTPKFGGGVGPSPGLVPRPETAFSRTTPNVPPERAGKTGRKPFHEGAIVPTPVDPFFSLALPTPTPTPWKVGGRARTKRRLPGFPRFFPVFRARGGSLPPREKPQGRWHPDPGTTHPVFPPERPFSPPPPPPPRVLRPHGGPAPGQVGGPKRPGSGVPPGGPPFKNSLGSGAPRGPPRTHGWVFGPLQPIGKYTGGAGWCGPPNARPSAQPPPPFGVGPLNQTKPPAIVQQPYHSPYKGGQPAGNACGPTPPAPTVFKRYPGPPIPGKPRLC